VAGHRWVYELHRDRTYQPLEKSIDRSFETGRSVVTVRAARKGPKGAFEMIQRNASRPLTGGDVTTSLTSNVVTFGGELLLHASGELASDADLPANDYAPPLRMLPTVANGESWSVGTWRSGNLSVALRGEVQALDAEPDCPGCIRVRYSGTIEGTVAMDLGPAAVDSGRLERIVWMKRGVGVVRDETTTETEVQLPDKSKVRLVDVVTLRLLEQE